MPPLRTKTRTRLPRPYPNPTTPTRESTETTSPASRFPVAAGRGRWQILPATWGLSCPAG